MRKVITVSAIALLSALTASSAFAAKTDTYKCEDQKIRVSFPDEDTAVMLYSDELIVLKVLHRQVVLVMLGKICSYGLKEKMSLI